MRWSGMGERRPIKIPAGVGDFAVLSTIYESAGKPSGRYHHRGDEMTDEIRLPVLSVKDGNVVANSRDVADYFEKRHGHVLDAIDALLRQAEEAKPEYRLYNYISDLGCGISRTYRSFDMTKDGFTLLAMGFTGERALRFKLAYIKKFNAMEAELRNRAAPSAYVPVPDSAEMEFIRLAKQVKGERFASALWDQMGVYCPPGFEPFQQGCLFAPANQNVSISITNVA